MIERIVEWSVRNRLAVLLIFGGVLAAGVWALLNTPVDAFPDTTPVQVQINTVASALNPEEIEQRITVPLELSIGGLPGLANVRSISKFGLSQVVATFTDETSIENARQYVAERIGGVELPEGIERPQLGPISSGLGEVLHYILSSENGGHTLDELRVIHEWVVKPELRKVAGVAEVNTWGGFEREYQVVASPEQLVSYGLTLDDVVEALEKNNANVGGGQMERAGEARVVYGLGRVGSLEEIANIAIRSEGGTPVRVRDVAEVRLGQAIRHGAVTAQGKGEAILGLCFMLMGENSRDVTQRLKERLETVRKALPEDVKLEVVYDRTHLVDEVIGTVRDNLVMGALLVVGVLFLLLGNLRAGLLVAAAIPLAMAFALLGMYEFSIAASLLSLGAIDFGILVDGSVVMTEIHMRRLADKSRALGRGLTPRERMDAVIQSSGEVIRPIAFGMAIILLVFVPVLTLEGIEGKMFKPMAWTFIFALTGALAIALLLSPTLSYYVLPRKARPHGGRINAFFERAYGALLSVALRAKTVVLVAVVAMLALTTWTATRLGGEFIPRLSEGAIVMNVIRLAGISIEESADYNRRMEQLLLEEFPDEIRYVWSRIGTAEVATDPMGIELTDVYLTLHPRDQWKKARTQAELVEAVEAAVHGLPGQNVVFTQPIELRLNELIAGIRSDVAIKIYGDDLDELVRLGDEVQAVMSQIPGAADVSADQVTGQPTVQISVKPEAIAQYGVAGREVLEFVEALGSWEAGQIVEGQRSFPLVVRLPDELRSDVNALAATVVPTSGGQRLPLEALAEVREGEGPATINREWGRRLIRVQTNVRARDVASFVEEARRRVEAEVKMPEGYVVEWGGQFENLQRSQRRLMVVVPIVLALIFVLLYWSLKSVRDVLIIYTGIPFAAIGAVLALWWRDIPFSVSAAVGFIALAGIAVLNGQILISTIRRLAEEGMELGEAIRAGAVQRLRPVMATAITDAAGFVPMALSTGIGAEVQRPLATVVVAGVVTSTVLTLFVLPVLVRVFGRRKSGTL